MSYPFPLDVAELVQKQLAAGAYVSEDDVLRDALRTLDAEREEWIALQAGLATLDQGNDGVPLDAAFDAIRAKHNIPADA